MLSIILYDFHFVEMCKDKKIKFGCHFYGKTFGTLIIILSAIMTLEHFNFIINLILHIVESIEICQRHHIFV